MASLDPTVSSLVDQPSKPSTARITNDGDDGDSDIDEDALIASLEDADLSHLRERRLQQLSEEIARAKALKASGTGTYSTVTSRNSPASSAYPEGDPNQAVLELTTSHERAVVHFYKDDFARCAIMDTHLQRLAERHYEVRFARVSVTEVPFLVEKLKIRVLPCIIGFVKGVAVERIVGFEGLGRGGDRFRTGDLERRMVASGVLVRGKMEAGEDGGVKAGEARRGGRKEGMEEDEGDDWD